MSREICDLCERESAVGFTVPDQIWSQVSASILQPVSILCVGCFTAVADLMLLPWDDDITFWPVSKSTFQQAEGKGNMEWRCRNHRWVQGRDLRCIYAAEHNSRCEFPDWVVPLTFQFEAAAAALPPHLRKAVRKTVNESGH